MKTLSMAVYNFEQSFCNPIIKVYSVSASIHCNALMQLRLNTHIKTLLIAFILKHIYGFTPANGKFLGVLLLRRFIQCVQQPIIQTFAVHAGLYRQLGV